MPRVTGHNCSAFELLNALLTKDSSCLHRKLIKGWTIILLFFIGGGGGGGIPFLGLADIFF